MHESPGSADRVRFGVFEVDLRSGELRKAGIRVSLQDQPFRILVRLLERPGELVTREQLRQELWPADTFVDFDHGLNAAIKRLRDALGDSAETPRFIETLPRRGYRFLPPVHVDGAAVVSGPPGAIGSRRSPARTWLVAGLTVALIGAAALGWRTLRRPLMTETDLIVLADVENQTVEPVLTGTLRQALAVKLSESHFVYLLSEQRVQDTLRMMRRKPDDPLTPVVARDVCQRAGAKATVGGAVASVGSSYVISLNATSCSTGETLVRDQARAGRKEDILPALDGMAVTLRRRLGESLQTIDAANTALERATTSSLEALKAFTEGERRFNDQRAAIPFYTRAIELDPDFAMAHAKLGVVCFNLDMSCGVPELTRAFELRERLTEREQFYLTAHYHRLARNDLESARPVYEVWKASYPRDSVPYNSLGFLYARLGRLDRMVAEFEGAARVAPTFSNYSNLFDAYLSVGRVADAVHLLERWERATAAPIQYARFLLAFQQRDVAAVERHAAALRNGQEGLDNVDAERARAAAFFGRMRRARELFAAAEKTHEGPDSIPAAARLKLEEAIWEAEIGNCQEARNRIAEAWPPRSEGLAVLTRGLTAIAHAACGDVVRAEKLIEGLIPPGSVGRPTQTIRNLDYAARARLDLARRHLIQVIEKSTGSEDLAGAPAYYLAGQVHGLVGAYLRGRARLGLNQGREAAAEFRKILDHPGVQLFAPYQALAPLYLGRAYASAGDSTRSRAAYEQFFSLWKEADSDVPVLLAARAEFSRLPDR